MCTRCISVRLVASMLEKPSMCSCVMDACHCLLPSAWFGRRLLNSKTVEGNRRGDWFSFFFSPPLATRSFGVYVGHGHSRVTCSTSIGFSFLRLVAFSRSHSSSLASTTIRRGLLVLAVMSGVGTYMPQGMEPKWVPRTLLKYCKLLHPALRVLTLRYYLVDGP
ncbi:hypothetical protein VFPPC_16591 [Pochonia chlamydosporia 170]|uniref:Uncharacterized protein n=1 Tax=Pochonia chlamydosporia 170 TaxID=1380566 RepID=A0A179F975_METCM|nr:hypothetical protein VFPPC_16591 [Pochonia chlamydosporia 170]OAQ62004.1 hypothetical protein VFPPC_16591 [Pochonia chlamydosporia 170]